MDIFEFSHVPHPKTMFGFVDSRTCHISPEFFVLCVYTLEIGVQEFDESIQLVFVGACYSIKVLIM